MSVAYFLSKSRFKLFSCQYAATYKTFINHHVQTDIQHPLSEVHRVLSLKRERKGLWWHVTISVNLSKAKVVRSWVRRRLQNAFLDELRKGGFEKDGRLIVDKKEKFGGYEIDKKKLEEVGDASLKGSLRLHANPEAVTAKYTDLRMETAMVVDALLQEFKKNFMVPRRKDEGKVKALMQPQKARHKMNRVQQLQRDGDKTGWLQRRRIYSNPQGVR